MDWAAADWQAVRESTSVTIDLTKRGGADVLPHGRSAQLRAVAAGFIQRPHHRHYESIAEVHEALIRDIDGAPDETRRAVLMELRWQALAWSTAIDAYFDNYGDQTNSMISRNRQKPSLSEPAGLPDSDEPADVCSGRLETRSLRFPSVAAFRGMVGVVILQFDADHRGRVHDATVLAVVPDQVFAEAVLSAAPKFRWRKARSAPAGCHMARSDHVVALAFAVGGP